MGPGAAGMLWYDNDPRTSLTGKIEKAMDYFANKYGRPAEFVLVNQNVADDASLKKLSADFKLQVRTEKFVLPGHMWVGCEVSIAESKR